MRKKYLGVNTPWEGHVKKEIYFCDDDNNILYAMKLIMHKTQFKGTFFSDPVDMISQIEPEWPGIVVTDLMSCLI